MVFEVQSSMLLCTVLFSESCAYFDLVNAITKDVMGAALEPRGHVQARSRTRKLNIASDARNLYLQEDNEIIYSRLSFILHYVSKTVVKYEGKIYYCSNSNIKGTRGTESITDNSRYKASLSTHSLDITLSAIHFRHTLSSFLRF